jgi:putative transposase
VSIRYTERLAEAGGVASVGIPRRLLRQHAGAIVQRALKDRADPLPGTLVQRRARRIGHRQLRRLVNNRRIHNEIGKVVPVELEQTHYRQNAA